MDDVRADLATPALGVTFQWSRNSLGSECYVMGVVGFYRYAKVTSY